MKFKITLGALLLVLWTASTLMARPTSANRYERPKECSKAKYTCVLKEVDGGAFFCMKLNKERERNSRQHIRAYNKVRCYKRFPARLKQPKEPKPEAAE